MLFFLVSLGSGIFLLSVVFAALNRIIASLIVIDKFIFID